MTYQGLHSDLDVLQSSYQPYQDDPGGSESEDDRPPQFHGGGRPGGGGDQEVMIHIVPEHGKSRWSHIDDLDSFFTKVYEYHQKHGFTVMILQEILELLQFIFIVIFTVFMLECVDYPKLFKVCYPGDISNFKCFTFFDDQDELPPDYKDGHKITLSEVVKTVPFGDMRFLTQVFILISTLFWLTRAFAVLHHIIQYWDIKCFYNTALKISDSSLGKL